MQLLISRYVEENKKYLYDSIKEKLNNNKIVYLIVPEQFTLGTEIEAFEALKIDSTFNLKIKSFTKLANEIIHQAGGRSLNFISDQAKYLMVQSILLDHKNDLKVFQNNTDDKEFIELLIRLMDQFADNNLDEVGLSEIVEKIGDDSELGKKLEDIKLISSEYRKLLAQSSYSSEDKSQIAIEKIKQIDAFKDAAFYFYRFHDMSNKELEMVKSIEAISDFSLVSLTLDKGLLIGDERQVKDADIFDISLNFYRGLREYIEDIEIINPSPIVDQTEIDILLANMFRYDLNNIKKEFPDPKDESNDTEEDNNMEGANQKLSNVYINKLNNTEDEVDNLAILIKKDLVDEGLNYKDISILVTESNEYFPKIEKIFQINGLPYFLDESRNLLDNAMVKYLKSAIKLLKNDLSPQNLIQFLKSSFLSIDRNSIDLFQNFVERRNFFGPMLMEDKYYSITHKQRYEEEDRENLEKIIQVKDLFKDILEIDGEDIFDLIHEDKPKSFQYYTELLYKFFTKEILLESYTSYEEKQTEEENEENRMIWNSFIELLDDMYLMPEAEIPFSRYTDILLSAIDNFKVGILPPSQDQIMVGNIKRSRFNKCKKIYVLGMTNIYYPPANDDVDILNEEEKLSLEAFDLKIRNTRKNNNANDLLSFYEILHSAKEKIVFSYSLVNSGNEAMDQAYILNFVRVLVNNANIKIGKISPLDYIYSKNKLNSYLPYVFAKTKNNSLVNEKEKIYYDLLYKKFEGDEDEYNTILNAIKISSQDKAKNNLDPNLVDKIFNLDKFSVSQLETFNSNPYHHFIRYGLKPREFDNIEFSRMDTGNLIHEFMKDYLDQTINKKQEVDSKLLFEKVLKDSMEDFKTYEYKNMFFARQMGQNADVYAKFTEKQLKESNIKDIDFEIKYGKDGKYKAIEIKVDGKEVFIEGKIDRVDKYKSDGSDYYRIIDYKTGSKKFDVSKIYHGIDLQLLLYLQSVVKSDKNSKALGAFYQNLSDQYYMLKDTSELLDEKKDLFANMKLDGIMVNNEKLIKETEEDFNPDKARESSVYKFAGRKGKFAEKENVIDESLFDPLFAYNIKNIEQTIKNIKNGNIELKTFILSKNSPYSYSNYKTIDKGEGLEYIYLDNFDWEKFKDLLEKNAREGEK
ncbi:PD-(D/E)XK nuclease family protein [Helcococcus massiliensis]|uniref:PD-(D/E)XK nuclease family protein n=1 Tax=Helcococcus massiliensis TaxID=2040290 RepID=UPI000CDEE096|nr:PD-(D/E)XK nuclease family protein [Helcococcus massiliensis]